MQLVAYGAQDVYLTGNPQITFFKVVYRRHTNFAVEGITIPLTGTANFGGKTSVVVQRNGDLMMQVYLRVKLNPLTSDKGQVAWVRRLGHALINHVTMNIGGAQIDKHYGTWLDIWYELTHNVDQSRGYCEMIGDTPLLTNLSDYIPETELFIPLQFWFCRNPGLALPLIALQYHEVRLDFEFARREELIVRTNNISSSDLSMNLVNEAEVFINYVYLDSEERRRFAQVGHEYLIEQLQFTGAQTLNASSSNRASHHFDLNFNHPTKELVWVLKNGNYNSGKRFLTYTPGFSNYEWREACDIAAQNLVNMMFTLTNNGDTSLIQINEGNTSGSCSTTSNNSFGNPDHKLNFLIHGVNGISLSTTEGAPTVYMKQNVLTIGEYNLADKIDLVDIRIGKNNNEFVIEEVVCLVHSISIRDISIPIEDWTDNRLNVSGTIGNVNDGTTDIVVYQHHNYGLLIDGSVNPVQHGKIQLNGSDRFSERSGKYFNFVQPHEHHTRTPADGINVYSFALKPEDHQPSGTANLSRIDKTTLSLSFNDSTAMPGEPSLNAFNSSSNFYVYDVNYNVLRVMSGMAGVAYSN